MGLPDSRPPHPLPPLQSLPPPHLHDALDEADGVEDGAQPAAISRHVNDGLQGGGGRRVLRIEMGSVNEGES